MVLVIFLILWKMIIQPWLKYQKSSSNWSHLDRAADATFFVLLAYREKIGDKVDLRRDKFYYKIRRQWTIQRKIADHALTLL